MNELKTALILYAKNFTFYDYAAYSWLFLTFLILIVFSALIAKKSATLSILTFFFSFILILGGPYTIKYLLDKTIRETKITNLKYYKLHFSDTLIVDFTIKNLSKTDFKVCLVDTKVYKASKSKLKSFINKLKPIRYRPILYKERLDKNSSVDKRVVFDNFRYNKDVNVSVEAKCY